MAKEGSAEARMVRKLICTGNRCPEAETKFWKNPTSRLSLRGFCLAEK
jgi:hypothetical protein